MIQKLKSKVDKIISEYGCGEKSSEKFKVFLKKMQKKLEEKNTKDNKIQELKKDIKNYYETSCILHNSKINKNKITTKTVNNKCASCGQH